MSKSAAGSPLFSALPALARPPCSTLSPGSAVREAGFETSPLAQLVIGDDLRLAWIGYSENDPEKPLRPVAKAGRGLDFLDQVKISWGESERRQDPAGTAVRTSKAYWINDIQADPKDSTWRSAAIAQGFDSCIALPLIAHDKHLRAVDLCGFLALLACAAQGLSAARFAEYLSIGEVPDATERGSPPDAAPGADRWVPPDDELLPDAATP